VIGNPHAPPAPGVGLRAIMLMLPGEDETGKKKRPRPPKHNCAYSGWKRWSTISSTHPSMYLNLAEIPLKKMFINTPWPRQLQADMGTQQIPKEDICILMGQKQAILEPLTGQQYCGVSVSPSPFVLLA